MSCRALTADFAAEQGQDRDRLFPGRRAPLALRRRLGLLLAAALALGLTVAGRWLLQRRGVVPPTEAGSREDLGEEVSGLSSRYCEKYPYLKFEVPDAVLHNNLGGKGPAYGSAEGIVYKTLDVGQGAGGALNKEVYLVVNATNSYEPAYPKVLGMQGKYASVNLNPGTHLDMRLTFLDRQTMTKLTMKEFALTLFDLDTGEKGTSREYAMVQGYQSYHVTRHTEVKVTKMYDGRTKFSATTVGDGADNPMDPMFLTAQQKNRAVSLLYHNVDAVYVTVGAEPGATARFFTFVARPSLLCAVTVQTGFTPPLPDLTAVPPMQCAIKAHNKEHFISWSVKKGDHVNLGQATAVTQVPHEPTQTYMAPCSGTLVGIQDKLKPLDDLNMRLDDKTLAVIQRPYLDPLPQGNGIVGGGPGANAVSKNQDSFVKYLVSVGDPVREGQPIAVAQKTTGKEFNLTSTNWGAVAARQEGIYRGSPLMMVKDNELITLSPYTPLGPITDLNCQGALVPSIGQGLTFLEYKVQVGDIIKQGDVIGTLEEINGHGRVPIRASHGGIVTALQPLARGAPISRVPDRNLATVGKFPPLPKSSAQAAAVFTQVRTPLQFAFNSGQTSSGPIEGLRFDKYVVAQGDIVKSADQIATVRDRDGNLHDIVAPQPGVVQHLQMGLRKGMYLEKVMQDDNLATIGRLPALEVGPHEQGSYAPNNGLWKFKEWKASHGDTVKRGDPVALLESTYDGSTRFVRAQRSGTVTKRMEKLQVGDVIERATKDQNIVTIGRFKGPEMGFRKVGVGAEMDDVFDFWMAKKGDRVHTGDPIAQVTRNSGGRRLSAQPIKIPSPATGTVDYEADLIPGQSIRHQSVGPTIARVDMGWPWWLFLLAALFVLCCCFACLFKVMQKPKPAYTPMPVEPEPEAPAPLPPPEPKPDGLRLDFDDKGAVRTVYAKYRPLGIKHNYAAPIIAHDFTINSYAKQDLGVQDGWKLRRIDDEELHDNRNFDEVNGKLTEYMKDFPLWPLPLEFRCVEESSNNNNREKTGPAISTCIKFLERPIGLEFANLAPIKVAKVYDDSPARRQGVKVGWILTRIGDFDVKANHNFRQVLKVFMEGVQPLDDSGRVYTHNNTREESNARRAAASSEEEADHADV